MIGFSAWSIKGRSAVSCIDLNKSSEAFVVEIYGTPEYVLNKEILSGWLGFEIAEDSCIVSEALVEELFGSIDIIGEKIDLDGKQYSIAGVVKDQNFVIFRPLKDGKVEHLEIKLEDKRDSEKIVEALLN